MMWTYLKFRLYMLLFGWCQRLALTFGDTIGLNVSLEIRLGSKGAEALGPRMQRFLIGWAKRTAGASGQVVAQEFTTTDEPTADTTPDWEGVFPRRLL